MKYILVEIPDCEHPKLHVDEALCGAAAYAEGTYRTADVTDVDRDDERTMERMKERLS